MGSNELLLILCTLYIIRFYAVTISKNRKYAIYAVTGSPLYINASELICSSTITVNLLSRYLR